MNKPNDWYFTSPWDRVPLRRGDALGFRAGADYFADQLAPGLNNGTSDARWISLLSWCLYWSQVVWEKAGGGELSGRDAQQKRYAWLRPLELLWVARSLKSGQRTGQLRGRRSVEKWINSNCKSSTFSMSSDQFSRYRQIGNYGAYRVIFRSIDGLTIDRDGWRPDNTAKKLAQLVNLSLPKNIQLEEKIFDVRRQWSSWNGKEARYWIEHGWPKALEEPIIGLLPTSNEDIGKRLGDDEGNLLKQALFPADSIRCITAKVLSQSSNASSHANLCEELAKSCKLHAHIGSNLRALPLFTRFADASMHAMRALWNELNQDGTAQAPSVKKLARNTELKEGLDRVRKEGEKWIEENAKHDYDFPNNEVVTQLAETMQGARDPLEQLKVLASHHCKYGGGRRWFTVQGDKIKPLVPDTEIAASDYRFRLSALSRLAAQCGVANMEKVLGVVEKNELNNTACSDVDDDDGGSI
jgi:hypothetical protein